MECNGNLTTEKPLKTMSGDSTNRLFQKKSYMDESFMSGVGDLSEQLCSYQKKLLAVMDFETGDK